MKTVRILAVGRIKTPYWRDAAVHYKKRLSRSLKLEEVAIKDADPKLPLETRKELETARLFKLLLPQDISICLDERGTGYTSSSFSALLRHLFEIGKRPCFLVGGAYGLAAIARATSAHCISFGPMTLPHELARIILFEQIYRAESIASGTGYHH
ncbi:MAG: 23S rRNA (pseudouridine(1915)-N(3))-methyltransferase RlmH [Desulfovibrio sp.]|jgi:23S rRNA (pseudouridine1915-N3)-methyltransferase|nr:23S rRNA (pseudouridine(1915)-N(3))-methyltransferase RlmH [Desulfovibrio sp.]